MNYEERCNFAAKELEAAKIWKSNYDSPIVKLSRKLGFKFPFPHYNSFFNNALSNGIYFGIAWGLFMYLSTWSNTNMPVVVMLPSALFAGVFFGLAMASYYRYSFKKHKLTPWHEIKNG